MGIALEGPACSTTDNSIRDNSAPRQSSENKPSASNQAQWQKNDRRQTREHRTPKQKASARHCKPTSQILRKRSFVRSTCSQVASLSAPLTPKHVHNGKRWFSTVHARLGSLQQHRTPEGRSPAKTTLGVREPVKQR